MKWNGMIFIALAGLIFSTPSFGRDPVDHGMALFNGTSLSTNGKRCSTCHPRGKTLEEAATYREKQLPKIINECIEKGLGGFPLPPESEDMESMIAYMRTFALDKWYQQHLPQEK